MPSRYPFQTIVRNEYLGVSKVIRAMTVWDLDWLADAQLAKWNEQENRRRDLEQKRVQRESALRDVDKLKAKADEDTEGAKSLIGAFQNILRNGLSRNSAIKWERLYDRRVFEVFQFDHPKPDRERLRRELLGPEPKEQLLAAPVFKPPGILEKIVPILRSHREKHEAEVLETHEREVTRARAEHAKRLRAYRAKEAEASAAYKREVGSYNAKLDEAKRDYIERRNRFLAEQQSQNNAVDAFRTDYERGTTAAVERYFRMVLERSPYPEGILGEPETKFDRHAKTVVVSFWLPSPADLPRVCEYKFVSSRKEIKAVEMKQKDFEALYDDVIHQIALRTTHEVLSADTAQGVAAVVFNGWVRGIDGKTGKPFTSCIISCQAPRDTFLSFDLANVSPKECVRGLKGITAGPLAMLAPVRPILDLNKDDDRFIQSRDVMDQLRPEDNLAAMDWDDFEHLIRELFELEFKKSGGEVHVTQASRDRGVDAIAFDPDPIRGGKFVIQAKRYNVVVPVSAVRDLYGTMIAEGATKGILVTTSHFGPDSREFAKDKPITLIDGENLVHMFQQHGRNLHISLLPKGDPRRGIGSAPHESS
jgi:restriction system protein